jgi:hypothetical protein
MSDRHNSDELTPTERRALAALKSNHEPPRYLETAVFASLRQSGRLRPTRGSHHAVAWVAAMAPVLIVLIALAWSAGARRTQMLSADHRFMLLLYGGDSASATTASARRREYTEWARGIAAEGVAINGEELADDGQEIGTGGELLKATAFAPPRGYFIVSVADIDSALRVASTCPHLRHGGRISIRRIVG